MNNSRTLKTIIATILLVVTLFTFAGCDIIMELLGLKNSLTIEATYVGEPIEVGGTLNQNDIVVQATLSEATTGTEITYAVTGFQVSPLDTSTPGDKVVQVIYTELGLTASCMLTITVVKTPVPTSILATYNGDPIQVGGTLSASDFTVEVVYDNNTTISVQSFTIGQLDTSVVGDKTVTISYTDSKTQTTLQTTVTVTVEPAPVTFAGIVASYVGAPIQVGQSLTKDNFLVQEVYSDYSKVATTNYTFSNIDTSTAGVKQVTISYQKDGHTYNATVNVTVVPAPVTLVSISATCTNGIFRVGETLTNADFTVVATFSDNHTSIVTDFVITGETTFTSSGTKSTQISYTYEGVTKTCNATVNVLSASKALSAITAVANNDTLTVGQSLKNSDFIVTAYFSDGSTVTVSDFTIVNPTGQLTTAGQTEVEISYTFNDQTRYVTININVLPEAAAEVANYGKYGILSKDGKSVKVVDTAKVVDTTNLQIHFLELGNQYTGDCTYIKAGDVDILIDAGSRYGSASTIDAYISKYVTDGILEYVIATHADQDHISGFVSDSGNSNKGIFKRYVCENIIDFPRSNKTTKVATNYKAERDAEVTSGANHYTALECWNNNNESTRFSQSVDATGARRYIKLASNIELEILYNYYYDNKTSDENDYSVCFMINQYGENYDYNNRNNPENEKNVNHFLFTGDLEEPGEAKLVQYNNLPEVVLFKGGHHGSQTSTTDALLNVIKPKVVCICCCTGTGEYNANPENTFPAQSMLNRVAKHTDLVFATSLWINSSTPATSLNGNITLTCNHLGINITASNNVTLLKDTTWFKNNRTCPTQWK